MGMQSCDVSNHKSPIVNNYPDLTDLRVFSGARRSSFVAAAQELGISTAYVSKRVAGLEQRLGVTLFHRTTRRVRISDQGELAYAWARKILDDVDAATLELSDTRSARPARCAYAPACGSGATTWRRRCRCSASSFQNSRSGSNWSIARLT